jgi:hypothetical protein
MKCHLLMLTLVSAAAFADDVGRLYKKACFLESAKGETDKTRALLQL